MSPGRPQRARFVSAMVSPERLLRLHDSWREDKPRRMTGPPNNGGLATLRPDQIWRPFSTPSTSRWACALSTLYLATTWVTSSSLFLSAPSSCSENLLHFAPISLRRICFDSARFPLLTGAVVGFAVFMRINSKISIKHHLNVRHSTDK